jgi:hypothetical protein
VHGGFVDGSGWQGVYRQLTNDGYTVSVVQNPTLSLAGDVEATRRVIDAQTEPVTLVGLEGPSHSDGRQGCRDRAGGNYLLQRVPNVRPDESGDCCARGVAGAVAVIARRSVS